MDLLGLPVAEALRRLTAAGVEDAVLCPTRPPRGAVEGGEVRVVRQGVTLEGRRLLVTAVFPVMSAVADGQAAPAEPRSGT